MNIGVQRESWVERELGRERAVLSERESVCVGREGKGERERERNGRQSTYLFG